jgi:hypothetical protein
MPLVYISAFGGVAAQFFSSNGVPLAGGKIYSYLAGTTTPAAAYTDFTGSTPHSNPIVLNSAGRVPGGQIWQPFGVGYKFTVYTPDDVLIATYDNVTTVSVLSAATQNFSGTGSQTVFTLANAPLSADTTNVFINGVYQQKNTYTLASATLTFSEAPPATSVIEIVYS